MVVTILTSITGMSLTRHDEILDEDFDVGAGHFIYETVYLISDLQQGNFKCWKLFGKMENDIYRLLAADSDKLVSAVLNIIN